MQFHIVPLQNKHKNFNPRFSYAEKRLKYKTALKNAFKLF